MRCHYFDGIAATLSDERKIANLPALIQDKLLQSDFIVPLFFTRYHRTIAAPSMLQARVFAVAIRFKVPRILYGLAITLLLGGGLLGDLLADWDFSQISRHGPATPISGRLPVRRIGVMAGPLSAPSLSRCTWVN